MAATTQKQQEEDSSSSFHTEVHAFFCMWMFSNMIPAPAWASHLDVKLLMKGMCYLPVIGTLIGAASALVFDAVRVTLGLPSSIAAVFSTAAAVRLTGCLHEDGLGDAADGIGGGWTRKQIFTIMSDSRMGTYGVVALILYLYAKMELLASLGTSEWKLYDAQGAGPALLTAHVMARFTAPYLIRMHTYVREEGAKAAFYATLIPATVLVTRCRLLVSFSYCITLAGLLYGPDMTLLLAVTLLAYAAMAGRVGDAYLGGVMGDFFGATICVGEIVLLTTILVARTALSRSRPDFSWTAVLENVNALAGDEMFAPLLRATIFWSIVVAWTMYARSSKTNMADKKENDESTHEKCTSPRDVLQKVLIAPERSFVDRYNAVNEYLDKLAKPVGSLGSLEEWSARLASLQRTMRPKVEKTACLIFAADHGAALAEQDGGEACSSFPQAVTRAVLAGLERGVAGASVLAKANGTSLRVVDVGVAAEPFHGKVVVSSPSKLENGTRNFCKQEAMTDEEVERCIKIGRENLAKTVHDTSADVIVLGEVGIGNTTASSALIAALTGESVETVCGGGAFAAREEDKAAVQKKIGIVTRALKRHKCAKKTPLQILAAIGGAEIAALVGAMLESSDRDIPVLVDGFIVTAAALVAVNISPGVCRVLFLSSQSAEKGQRAALERIQSISKTNNLPIPASPILSMGLRMGEGTAALLALPILKSASAVLSEMATIDEILGS